MLARDEVQFLFEQRVLQMTDVAVKVGLVELVLEWLRPRITLAPLSTVGPATVPSSTTTVQDQAKFSRLMAGSVMATYSPRCPLSLTPAFWGGFLETCMRAQRPGAALIVFEEMTTRHVPVTSEGLALLDMARLNAVTTKSISFSCSSNLTTAAFFMPATSQPHGKINNIAYGNRKMRLSGVRAPPL